MSSSTLEQGPKEDGSDDKEEEIHRDAGRGRAEHLDAIPVRRRLETAVVVISWFALNISIASSTKWIFVKGSICIEDKGCVPYKFPVAITVIHMIFSWMLCRFYIFHVRGDEKAVLSCQQQLQEIMPLSICFALSVAMGNLSLKYIYPSFNQMLGSMSPLITVLLAVFFQQKRFSMKTWLSMPVICMGLAMCSVKELNFNVLGAFYATGATVLRAVKSLIQGRLLSPSHKLDSVSLLYYMAPISAIWLFLLMLLMEGTEPIVLLLASWTAEVGTSVTGIGTVMYLLVLSGLNACLLNIANFLVTSYTSPVTLQVLGNVKSCLSIAVSVAIFRNSLTFEQAVGVGTCLVGVWLYNQKEPKAPSVVAPAGSTSWSFFRTREVTARQKGSCRKLLSAVESSVMTRILVPVRGQQSCCSAAESTQLHGQTFKALFCLNVFLT